MVCCSCLAFLKQNLTFILCSIQILINSNDLIWASTLTICFWRSRCFWTCANKQPTNDKHYDVLTISGSPLIQKDLDINGAPFTWNNTCFFVQKYADILDLCIITVTSTLTRIAAFWRFSALVQFRKSWILIPHFLYGIKQVFYLEMCRIFGTCAQ